MAKHGKQGSAMTETVPEREARVIRVFVELADTLVDDYDVIDLLDRLAGSSVDLLAADAAGILLVGFQSSAARADLPFRQHVRTR